MCVLAVDIIEPINESPGIYFDSVGIVKVSEDNLHVLVPVDIVYIQPHLVNLKDILSTSKSFCQQVEQIETKLNNTTCHHYFQPLGVRFDGIMRDYSAISHLISTKDKRSAWLPGIGTAFKQIIGTMDNYIII